MDILERVAAQIESIQLPLFAVTLTALPKADTPLLLMLHWHGFRPDDPLPGEPEGRLVPVPASALQLNDRWSALSAVEFAVLDAAWQLGAWNLERAEKGGCSSVCARPQEELECRQAFGEYPALDGASTIVEDAPDRADMMQLAADVGYVCWQFRPVSGGIWPGVDADDTLAPDGRRAPPCPVIPVPPTGRRAARTVYRLGRAKRLVVF